MRSMTIGPWFLDTILTITCTTRLLFPIASIPFICVPAVGHGTYFNYGRWYHAIGSLFEVFFGHVLKDIILSEMTKRLCEIESIHRRMRPQRGITEQLNHNIYTNLSSHLKKGNSFGKDGTTHWWWLRIVPTRPSRGYSSIKVLCLNNVVVVIVVVTLIL